MAVRRLAPKELQPANFTFTAENLAWAKAQIAKYPEGRQASAVIPILWRGPGKQDSGGFPTADPPGAGFVFISPHFGRGGVGLSTLFLFSAGGEKRAAPVCRTPPP